MRMSYNGLIIIYIGDGKGKTTAAVGLAVRAAGAGKRVLFCQFVKAAEVRESGEWPRSSEIDILEKTPNVTVKILGRGFVGILGDKKRHEEHEAAAREGLQWLKREITGEKYEVVVADELISALELELVSVEDILNLMKLARENPVTALVLTGHNKYNELIEAADLVTEMKMVKHPYYKGQLAKKGIDF